MKFEYGFEYTESDYENLTKSTTSIFAGLGTVLIKGIEAFTTIEGQRLTNRHERDMKSMDRKISEDDDVLSNLKKDVREQDWEIKKLKSKIKNRSNISFLNEQNSEDDQED